MARFKRHISRAAGAVSIRSIERLRERFVEGGLDMALKGKKREKYKDKVFDGATEVYVVALRCSQPPSGHARWTVRLLAQQMVELKYVETIGRETVRKMLKKTRSSPGGSRVGRAAGAVIPEASAEFVSVRRCGQMEEILDIYQRPYDPLRPVVCLDEARRQLVSETRQGFTDKNGVQCIDYDRDGGPL